MSCSSSAGRRSLVAVGVPALVVTLGVGGVLVGAPRVGGPLEAASAVAVEFPLREGQTGTWGVVLPSNPTVSRITIEAIEAMDGHGLEVVAILLNDPERDGGIGSLDAFPPPGIHARAADGARLPPVGSASPYLQVLVGVRLTGSGDGTIAALRMRYRHDGTTYETELPYTLRVTHESE